MSDTSLILMRPSDLADPHGRPEMTLLDQCAREMRGGWGAPAGYRWVMNLASYKQLRADCEAATGRRTDPDTWIPDPADQLFGIWIEVRDDGGVPHLEH